MQSQSANNFKEIEEKNTETGPVAMVVNAFQGLHTLERWWIKVYMLHLSQSPFCSMLLLHAHASRIENMQCISFALHPRSNVISIRANLYVCTWRKFFRPKHIVRSCSHNAHAHTQHPHPQFVLWLYCKQILSTTSYVRLPVHDQMQRRWRERERIIVNAIYERIVSM